MEEGLFCADDLTDEERRILEEYAAANDADAADTGDTKGLLKRVRWLRRRVDTWGRKPTADGNKARI